MLVIQILIKKATLALLLKQPLHFRGEQRSIVFFQAMPTNNWKEFLKKDKVKKKSIAVNFKTALH